MVQMTVENREAPGPSYDVAVPPKAGLSRALKAPEFGVVVAAVVVWLLFALFGGANGFTSLPSTATWLNTAAALGIIAIPVGMLMIAGEFDLSIGSMVGAGSITTGLICGHLGLPLGVALLVALVIALVVGVVNGILVTQTEIPSFVVTLAMNLVVAGAALVICQLVTNTTSVTVNVEGGLASLFTTTFGGFRISILWFLVVALVSAWILAYTRMGSWIRATGHDTENARRAGVRTTRLTIVLFVCTALAGTLVGVMQAAQYSTGDPTVGQGYVFEAPIVVVIGGVLLHGGYGTVTGIVAGTVLYGVISAGLFYTGWDSNLAQVLIGVLMVVAVLVNHALKNRALRSAARRR